MNSKWTAIIPVILLGSTTMLGQEPRLVNHFEPLYIASINYENQEELIFPSDTPPPPPGAAPQLLATRRNVNSVRRQQQSTANQQVAVISSDQRRGRSEIEPLSQPESSSTQTEIQTSSNHNDEPHASSYQQAGNYSTGGFVFDKPRPFLYGSGHRVRRNTKRLYTHTSIQLPENAILFKRASTWVSSSARQKLKSLRLRSKQVILHGYADSTGPGDINYDLSRERADNVAEILKEFYPGIRVSIVAHGESAPAFRNKTTIDTRFNRTVIIESR